MATLTVFAGGVLTGLVMAASEARRAGCPTAWRPEERARVASSMLEDAVETTLKNLERLKQRQGETG